MSDTAKAQKLASARKKFKELKKEKKKNAAQKLNENGDSVQTSREQTPIDNGINEVETSDQSNQLTNYFDNSNYGGSYQQPAVFFDSFAPSNSAANANVFEGTASGNTNISPSNYFNSSTNYFNVHSNDMVGFQRLDNPSQDINAMDSITSSKLFDQFNTIEPIVEVSSNANVQSNTETVNNEAANTTETEVLPISDPVIVAAPFSSTDLAHNSISSIHQNSNGASDNQTDSVNFPASISKDDASHDYSSIESLKQLSVEIAELINPNSDLKLPTRESNLELRNQELTSFLNQEKTKNDQLSASLHQSQLIIAQLQSELKEKQLTLHNTQQQDINDLKEKLQCHVQTVQILVAEKGELSAHLSQFQLEVRAKVSECEELQTRLKASRTRVIELEREINILKTEKSENDNLGKGYANELDKIQQDCHKLKEEKEEMMQDVLETREKLKATSESNTSLQQQIVELSSQLSMANIKIQQLTTVSQDQFNDQVEQLTRDKLALAKQIDDLNSTLKLVSKEREDSNLHYQQYAQQLSAQINTLISRLEQLEQENEGLRKQEQNRIRHIGDLEKQLQNVQSDHITFAPQRTNGEVAAQLETSREVIADLQHENEKLHEETAKIFQEKAELDKELDIKNDIISHMEDVIAQLRGSQPDNAKLLATMESDKVAASRAVSQNAEMKKQMESMQEVFMKLNNDKLELTEKLTTEQHNSKELFDKLQKTELHLQTLADAIEIKDKELCHLRENSAELTKQMLQSEQLTDRLRHYEAQDHGSHCLQTELQEAHQTILKLKEDLDHVRENKLQSEDKQAQGDGTDIVELKQRLESLEIKNKDLETQLKNVNNQSEIANDEITPTDTNHNDNWNVLDKETAMKHLEHKFLRMMDDIATLTDEKQRLEHVVTQLQGETETIGEYIALYQQQRSILKQKTIEKDQQLIQLENDRLQIKDKLDKLNDLVKKLVLEKGTITTELLQHHEDLNKESHELCEEHAKLQSQINKITEQSIKAGTVENGDSASTETAEQIIALLSEIKTSNLVQPSEMIHHCPWCSGQLITV